MLNYKTLELLYDCGQVPTPIFVSFEKLHMFVDALLSGNADWDEVKLVSDRVQAIYNAGYALYCEDVIKTNMWVILKDAIKEFAEMFKRICHDNKVLHGDWEWLKT